MKPNFCQRNETKSVKGVPSTQAGILSMHADHLLAQPDDESSDLVGSDLGVICRESSASSTLLSEKEGEGTHREGRSC
jgi:hypothetical protein